jgi:methionyl-tRNA formyltransferase
MTNARIVFAGSPEFAVPVLRALDASRHKIVAVLTQPDKPAGRGLKLRSSPVMLAAETAGLKILQPQTLRETQAQAQLSSLTPDLLVVAAYGQLLPPEVLAIPRVACINLHASLLPRWRGASPIQTAIFAGDAETGISLMQMNEGLDTGDVYSMASTTILPTDTAGSLQDRLAELGAELMLHDLDAILDGTLKAKPQPDAGVCHAPRIRKTDGRIDWHRSAVEIDRQIRAFNPWPVAETSLAGGQLRCWNSRCDSNSVAPSKNGPGTVLGLEQSALVVQTGAGQLLLERVQLPGRKPVTATQFSQTHDLTSLVLGT